MALPQTIESPAATASSQPALPPPQLFDVLPALHEILSRIDHSSTRSSANTDGDDALGTAYKDLAPLEPKDLPSAILPLKSQIRKGLRELEKLPDVERTVEEQNAEIAALESRIRRQQEVLKGMSSHGRRLGERVGE
jgi:hypothetical protein